MSQDKNASLVEQVRERLAKWNEELPHIIQVESAHLKNIEQMTALCDALTAAEAEVRKLAVEAHSYQGQLMEADKRIAKLEQENDYLRHAPYPEDAWKDLTAKLSAAESALEYYADENGGPYATGDYHTADGGERARAALAEIRGRK